MGGALRHILSRYGYRYRTYIVSFLGNLETLKPHAAYGPHFPTLLQFIVTY